MQRILRALLREMRIALAGYRDGDPLRCETCGKRVADDDAVRDAAGWPYCSTDCYERHYSHLF